jgi:hypothetical protein
MTRKWEAIWLGVATAASLALMPFAAIGALLSPMVFDPHRNLLNPAAWLAFVLIITLWIVCLAAPYGAWVAFLRRQATLTWLVMAAPLLWALAAVATMNFLHN